jgi:hypothetical protein
MSAAHNLRSCSHAKHRTQLCVLNPSAWVTPPAMKARGTPAETAPMFYSDQPASSMPCHKPNTCPIQPQHNSQLNFELGWHLSSQLPQSSQATITTSKLSQSNGLVCCCVNVRLSSVVLPSGLHSSPSSYEGSMAPHCSRRAAATIHQHNLSELTPSHPRPPVTCRSAV